MACPGEPSNHGFGRHSQRAISDNGLNKTRLFKKCDMINNRRFLANNWLSRFRLKQDIPNQIHVAFHSE